MVDTVREGTDTTASLAVGATITGTIDQDGIDGANLSIDKDWYLVTLLAGHVYTFSASAGVSNTDTLDQIFMRLYDAGGNPLSPDRSAEGGNVSFTFTPTTNATYYIAISAGGSGAWQDKTGAFTINLTDGGAPPPPPPPPTFAISGPGNVVEGDNAVFTVTMTGTITTPTTVWYSTLQGSASASAGDYPNVFVNQALTFNPGGPTTQQILIPTLVEAGNPAEGNESFSVGLQTTQTGNPFTSASATILASGGAPPPTFSISGPGNVAEGSNAAFTVTMSGTITAPTTIWYSTLQGTASAGAGDYPGTFVNQALTFNPGGPTSQQILIPTLVEPGNPAEGNETFSVGLQTTQAGSPFTSASATIIANGGTNQAPVVTGQSTVSQSVNQTFNFTSLISASDPDGSIASYTFSDATPGAGHLTLNGTPISGSSVSVTAANLAQVGYATGAFPGTNQIVIEAFDNQGRDSNDFTMTINVAAVGNQAPTVTGQSTVTQSVNQSFNFTSLIAASDPDGSIASYTFWDSTPGAGHLTLNGTPISGSSVSVAAANLGQVGYATGASAGSNQIVIEAFDNLGLDSNDFAMSINVEAAVATGYSLSPASSTVTESNTTLTFTVTRSGSFPAETIYASTLFDTATSTGGDYDGIVNQTLTFALGQPTATFTVDVNSDTLVESTEHFRVMIARNQSDQSTQALDISDVTIVDDDSGAQGFTISPGNGVAPEGAGSISFEVSRANPQGSQTVYISTAQTAGSQNVNDYAPIENLPVTFANGEASKLVTVALLNDAVVEASESFAVIVQNSPNPSPSIFLARAVFTIQNDDAGGWSISPATQSVAEGGNLSVTITRPAGLPAETVYVSTTYDDGSPNRGDYGGLLDKEITFAAGVTTRTIQVSTTDDPDVEGSETFGIVVQQSADDPVAARLASAHFTITDNDTTQTNPPQLPSAADIFATYGQVGFLGTLAYAAYSLHPDEHPIVGINNREDDRGADSTAPAGSSEEAYNTVASQLHLLTPLDLPSLTPAPGDDPNFPGFLKPGLRDGVYVSGNAAALVASAGDALFISFRGTNDFGGFSDVFTGGISPDQDHWKDIGGTDEGMQDHYALLLPLISAIDQYLAAHPSMHVFVTGHSLGGAMVQQFMHDHLGAKYSAITFGSPGFETISDFADSRIVNVTTQDDWVPLADDLLSYGSGGHTVTVTQPQASSSFGSTPAFQFAALSAWDAHSPSLYAAVAQVIPQTLAQLSQRDNVPLSMYQSADGVWHAAYPTGILLGQDGADFLRTGFGTNEVHGLGGDDFLYGSDGADTLDGGPGFDFLVGGSGGGDDFYDGGSDVDTLSYESTSLGVSANLSLATNNGTGPEVGADQIRGIETLIGGTGADTLIGDSGANTLSGGAGNDTLRGDVPIARIVRASVGNNGVEANGGSPNHENTAAGPSISADGRFVAFISSADNLVVGDTNGVNDAFVFDRLTQTTERVNLSSDGSQQTGYLGFGADDASISGDGRYVAFSSTGPDLVPGDTNGFISDIYVYDRTTDTIARVSVNSAGVQANNYSYDPEISGDGQFVVYRSGATNLVANDTNNFSDLFLFNRATGETSQISIGIGASQANGSSFDPSISADGRYVAFWSEASNLVAGDTNNERDAFVYDRVTGTTERVSVANDGSQSNGRSEFVSMSGDGRYVAFSSVASNLVTGVSGQNLFVYDRITHTTECVSMGLNGALADSFSSSPSLSYDGRYVAFQSLASNLVAGDTNGAMDVFVYDRVSGTTTRMSSSEAGQQGAGTIFFNAELPALSADGHFVAFDADAPNLVAEDTNSATDIFVAALPAGLAGNDVLAGGSGNDDLDGGGGDDVLDGGAGSDLIKGGVGTDIAIYDASASAVALDLQSATASGGDAAGDTLTGIEGLQGSAFNDSLFGDGGANRLIGLAGADFIQGRAGADTIAGGDGDDWLDGGAGGDAIDGGNGFDTAAFGASTTAVNLDLQAASYAGGDAAGDVLTAIEGLSGSSFNDQLFGNASVNNLFGQGGADFIQGRAGNDVIDGGDGDDWLDGGAGADTIAGGNGFDTAAFGASATAVSLDLGAFTYTGGDAAGDVLSSIEGLSGSSFNDQLFGNASVNNLFGQGGADFIQGRAGNDVIDGGDGDDWLDGGTGADTIAGGNGFDIAAFGASATAVNLDLGAFTYTGGDATGDVLSSIEGVSGSSFADQIFGNNSINGLYGQGGADFIQGRGGNDVIEGGDGDDWLDGGTGGDNINGGNGIDIAAFGGSASAVTADLQANTYSGGDAAGDLLSAIEGLSGSTLNDVLSGNTTANRLYGQGGNDTLAGRGGDDLLVGGDSNDTFAFANNGGVDQISDFDDFGNDLIQLSVTGIANFNDVAARMTQVGADVVIDFATTDIWLTNTTLATVQADDFVFV